VAKQFLQQELDCGEGDRVPILNCNSETSLVSFFFYKYSIFKKRKGAQPIVHRTYT
jgi:hypothetical protein